MAASFALTSYVLADTYALKQQSQREGETDNFNAGYGHIPPVYLSQTVASWWFLVCPVGQHRRRLAEADARGRGRHQHGRSAPLFWSRSARVGGVVVVWPVAPSQIDRRGPAVAGDRDHGLRDRCAGAVCTVATRFRVFHGTGPLGHRDDARRGVVCWSAIGRTACRSVASGNGRAGHGGVAVDVVRSCLCEQSRDVRSARQPKRRSISSTARLRNNFSMPSRIDKDFRRVCSGRARMC